MSQRVLFVISVLVFGALFWFSAGATQEFKEDKIRVGSKIFTESYILAEIIAQTIESVGEVEVERRLGLGATGIVFEALKKGDIDVYPEYTGTISEAILKSSRLREAEIRQRLAPLGFEISESLGFNNTYALAARADFAQRHGLKRISDLKDVLPIRVGFTHEFLRREDGFQGLIRHYGLSHIKAPEGFEHSLAYESLFQNRVDLIEVYSTDAKLSDPRLMVLEDDRNYFSAYLAVLFYRTDRLLQHTRTWEALRKLEGQIDEKKMIELNALVEKEGLSPAAAAARFLGKDLAPTSQRHQEIVRRALEHINLVLVSLLTAILVGVPLGFLSTRSQALANAVLSFGSVLQTIPSLALLCFLIPIFGVGYGAAVFALFLYALLPVIRNTYLGFTQIDPRLIESARSLGLSRFDRFRWVELPLAFPSILAGIQLSAVINVGTATLAAFIGAGGLGAIIVSGLTLNNQRIILEGAVPAALMALVVHGMFEVIERVRRF